MKLDEVIDKLIECHTRWARWSETSDIVKRDAVEGAIQFLQEYRDLSRDGLVPEGLEDQLMMCPVCHGAAHIEVGESYRDDVRIIHNFRAVCDDCGANACAAFEPLAAVNYWNSFAVGETGGESGERS